MPTRKANSALRGPRFVPLNLVGRRCRAAGLSGNSALPDSWAGNRRVPWPFPGRRNALVASAWASCHTSQVKTTFDIAEAQARLPRLLRTKQTVSLCQNNETVAFLVPRARMEALLETMEILANPAAMKAIRRDLSGKGKYLPLSVLDES